MMEEVYQYLHDYGFSAIELDRIEDKNDNMFFTDVKEVRKNLTFLEEKYLEVEDIMELINDNPFMLTEKNNRLEAIDDIYCELGIDYESLKKILKNNSRAYTLSPIELNKIIKYLKDRNCSIRYIRDLFIKNPKILNMNFEDFERSLNTN